MDWKGLLTGATQRLADETRYGNVPKIRRETVAEHSYFVTLYAFAIADSLPVKLDYKELGWLCLTHDAEESVSGDLPRTFKYSDPTLTAALREAALIAFRQWLDTWSTENEQRKYLFRLNEPAPRESLLHRVVKVADFMSCVSYVYGEWQLGNIAIVKNTALRAHWAALHATEKELDGPLLPALEGAQLALLELPVC